MKTVAFFLTVLSLSLSPLMSQVNLEQFEVATHQLVAVSADEIRNKPIINSINKAPGDTLWYEDFGNGFSTNQWVSTGSTPWIYTTQGPGGQYSTSAVPLNSTTKNNGFASLPSDFYNTPTPPGGFTILSEYLTSGPITIPAKSSILVRWQQSFRYCCNVSSVLMELQVSTDNMNWTSFDAKIGISPNVIHNNFLSEIDVSSVAAGQRTIYLRFYQSASHYYWMIDDIAIVEGQGSSNNGITMPATYLYNYPSHGGSYTMMPCGSTNSLYPAARVKNESGINANNVQLKAAVVSGANVYYSGISNSLSQLLPNSDSVLVMQSAVNAQLPQGAYNVVYKTNSSILSQNTNAANYSFMVTDSVYARDYDQPTAEVGPGSFVGGNVNGSRLALSYDLFRSEALSSISFYVTNNPLNVGAGVKVSVRSFDTTAGSLNAALNTVVAQSANTYVIQTSDLGQWISIPLMNLVTAAPGRYVAVVEQSDGFQNGRELYMGRDVNAENYQSFDKDFISFLYANGGFVPNWGVINTMPMIRLNVATPLTGVCAPVSLKEEQENSEAFQIQPNPTKGVFNLILPLSSEVSEIIIYGIEGRVVKRLSISNGNSPFRIDMTDQPKGLYFIQSNAHGRMITQKVVVY